jgi:hypothetical protein
VEVARCWTWNSWMTRKVRQFSCIRNLDTNINNHYK